MDQNYKTIVETFRNSSIDDRKKFLLEILPSLYPSERVILYESLARTNVSYDIMGALPLELVLKITAHLHATEIFLFRRVSKRWQHILSSESVARQGLSRYFPAEAKSPAHQETLETKEPLLRNLLFREKAAGNGMVLNKGELFVSSREHDDITSVVLRQKWMAIVTMRRLLLVEMDRLSSARPLITPSRESIAKAAIGPNHVVAVSFHLGSCHIWNLEGEHVYKWRLSSGDIREIVVSARCIALLSGEPSSDAELHVLELVALRAFSYKLPVESITIQPPLPVESEEYPQALVVDDETECIFIIRDDEKGPPSVFRSSIRDRTGISVDEPEYLSFGDRSKLFWSSKDAKSLRSLTISKLLNGSAVVPKNMGCYIASRKGASSWTNWDQNRHIRSSVDESCPIGNGPRASYGSVDLALVLERPQQRESAEAKNSSGDMRWVLYTRHPARLRWERSSWAPSFGIPKAGEIPNLLVHGHVLVVVQLSQVWVCEIPDYDAYNTYISATDGRIKLK